MNFLTDFEDDLYAFSSSDAHPWYHKAVSCEQIDNCNSLSPSARHLAQHRQQFNRQFHVSGFGDQPFFDDAEKFI